MNRLFLLLFFLLNSLRVIGCDCSIKPSMKRAIRDSKAIIVGKVVNKEYIKIIRESPRWVIAPDSIAYAKSPFTSALNKYTIEVTDYIKGKKRNEGVFYIYSEITTGMCGFNFKVGGEYIIYADVIPVTDSKGKSLSIYFTNSCTRTTEYSDKEFKSLKNELGRRKCK